MSVKIKIPTDPSVLGYLAGIIDGEGCVTMRPAHSKASSSPAIVAKLTIGNTDQRLMVWLVANVGGSYRAKKGRVWLLPSRWKTPYDWDIHGANAAALLRAVHPYLLLKKEQAALLIQLAELKTTRRRPLSIEQVQKEAELKAQLHILNRRGKDVA